MFKGLCQTLQDDVLVVSLPKRLIIRNNKLGCLLWSIQGVLAVGVFLYCLLQEIWLRSYKPFSWGLEIWREPAWAVAEGEHCNHPQTYWHNSSTKRLSPHGCEAVLLLETQHQDVGSLFLPTLIKDRSHWQLSGEACNASAEVQCNGLAGLYQANGDGQCTCGIDRDFLATNPEEDMVLLRHSYTVWRSEGVERDYVRGGVKNDYRTEGANGETWRIESELLTIILSADGSRCSIGGKSEWPQADARWGIAGTLREWLACAGITLDSDPKSVASGDPKLASTFRTMGVTLHLVLAYDNNSPGISTEACFVTVEAQVAWTSAPAIHDFVFVPNDGGLVRTEHVRNQWGVLITTHVTGTFWSFNPTSLVDALVQILVLFQLPMALCRFIALYCLGHVSEIYRRARTTKFDIYSAFHGGIARMLLAEIGFRGLLGGDWKSRLGTRAALTSDSLYGHVQEVFQEQLDARAIKTEELRQIAALTYRHMNHDGLEGISVNDFIRSVMHDETFDPSLLCKVLVDQKIQPVLQKFFSGNTSKLRRSMASSASVDETEVADMGDFFDEAEDHWDPPAEECKSSNSDDEQLVAVDPGNVVRKQQREALADAPMAASPQAIGKAVDASATGATGPLEVEEKRRETDYRQAAEFRQVVRDLEDMVAHFRKELEVQASSIRADLEHAARLKDETVALCCKVQGAADVSQQCMARLEERLLLLAVDRRDSSPATGVIGTTGSGREGNVGDAVAVQPQSGKGTPVSQNSQPHSQPHSGRVTPRSPSSLLSGLLAGAMRSNSRRERANSTPPSSTPAAAAPQVAEVNAVALLEAAGAAVRQHSSEAANGNGATQNAFLEACHAPAATRSVSLAGSAFRERTAEGERSQRPHHSKTPTMRRTEAELNMAWEAARTQHFGSTTDGEARRGTSIGVTSTGSVEHAPAVSRSSRPRSPPAPEESMVDIDRVRDTAEHLLRQQRLQQWQQRAQPREESILGTALVAAGKPPRGSSSERPQGNRDDSMFL